MKTSSHYIDLDDLFPPGHLLYSERLPAGQMMYDRLVVVEHHDGAVAEAVERLEVVDVLDGLVGDEEDAAAADVARVGLVLQEPLE